jgi:tetratricopeptide (TPR) repeat protein
MSLNKSKALRTAEKYVLQGKIPAAIDEYRKVVTADPGDLITINTLGDLYVRAGKIQDAIANFSRIADSYREGGFTLKAIAMLKKISKLDPTNIDTSMKLANLYSQQGLLVEARQQYLQVADAYARAGQTRKALEAYQKIADLDPSNTSVRMKLGEIYSREGMIEQAHDAFVMAGAELQRKADIEQALNANLKAIAINPDSRQALTAIAAIYTQQGQIDRAINILCEAFERNPGDVELLTILGRTYLSAGMMDDAERTFLSLVELDRNRYHYLLEVGRRFLQTGDLDRAVEQVDGCLEVLIAKREEDKAIDFLRRVLDRDMNHIGALKRLAQIFARIREDHNLIATLNSLSEAAMRKGDDEEAIAALKELARVEPDDPVHLQRLYNLGVTDIVEADSPDVVRATGPLDFQSAAFDDAFVVRQISEAEILAGHGQVVHAVEILTEILNYAPENLQVHFKLKDIYLRAGLMDKAAGECLQLARIHEARGESARASDYLAEARQLNPLIDAEQLETSHADTDGDLDPRGSGVDWSNYQTGQLAGSGFVTVPETAVSDNGSDGFRYSDTLISDPAEAPTPDVFNSASVLPSDTMPRALRDELEGIDFYIAQGYAEIARDTLDRLREEHGENPEIAARYNRLVATTELVDLEAPTPAISDAVLTLGGQPPEMSAFEPGPAFGEIESGGAPWALPESTDAATDEDAPGDKPFLIQKESGPLYSDLLVELNTRDLSLEKHNNAAGAPAIEETHLAQDALLGSIEETHLAQDALLGSIEETHLAQDALLESIEETHLAQDDLLGSIVSNIDDSFDAIRESRAEPSVVVEENVVEKSVVEENHFELAHEQPPTEFNLEQIFDPADLSSSDDIQEIFDELKEQTGDLKPLLDFETHYSLGLAYKDMDLLDEAIAEFQMAFRTAGIQGLEGDYIHCCNMLGLCFKRKQMPKVAVMWYQRGRKIPNRLEDEYQALRFEIGLCYEEMGEIGKALDAFGEVYGIDINYRKVGEKISQLQAANEA